MKFILILTIVLSFCSLALANTRFEEKDLIWKNGHKAKRHAPGHAWQSDGQAAPGQTGGPAQPIVPLQCNPEISTIGKRSVGPSDSFPNLNSFYMNAESSDVKLVVNGTKLPAHRFVLMAKSPKFAEMFRADPTKGEFDLEEDSEDFKVLLKYFYTERFALEDESDYRKAISIYKMAQNYGMENLKLQIERTLAKMIFLDNYLDIYKFAVENQMHELVRLWMTFVFANSQQIITDESFMNETVGVAEKVLAALNVQPSYVLMQIRKLMEANPNLDVNHFRSIVYIERCSFEDLLTMAEMKLYDEKFLLDDMVKRYRVLAANCNYRQPMVRHSPRWVPQI